MNYDSFDPSLFSFFEALSQAQQTSCLIGGLALSLLIIIAAWKIYKKAGRPGWASIIPIYNAYKFCEIADGKGIKFLLLLIPIVNVIYALMLEVRLAKAFGKGGLFALGLIFLPNIFYLILAFGGADYIGPRGIPEK